MSPDLTIAELMGYLFGMSAAEGLHALEKGFRAYSRPSTSRRIGVHADLLGQPKCWAQKSEQPKSLAQTRCQCHCGDNRGAFKIEPGIKSPRCTCPGHGSGLLRAETNDGTDCPVSLMPLKHSLSFPYSVLPFLWKRFVKATAISSAMHFTPRAFAGVGLHAASSP